MTCLHCGATSFYSQRETDGSETLVCRICGYCIYGQALPPGTQPMPEYQHKQHGASVYRKESG